MNTACTRKCSCFLRFKSFDFLKVKLPNFAKLCYVLVAHHNLKFPPKELSENKTKQDFFLQDCHKEIAMEVSDRRSAETMVSFSKCYESSKNSYLK